MKEEIKELRLKIDMLSQLTKELKPYKSPTVNAGFNSREISKCYESLILAKAWLGKILGELGQENPYKNDGKRSQVSDIEPTNDKASLTNDIVAESLQNCSKDFNLLNHIEKVDWLREEIQHVTHLVYQYCVENSKTRFHSEITYRHLCEARFWLGFEMERIKNESTSRI